MTGCRKSEILTLRRDDVDRTAGEFRLRDGRRGPRMVPMTTPILDGIERIEGNPWVIPSRKPGIHLPDLTYYWNRIQARAGLEGVHILGDLANALAGACPSSAMRRSRFPFLAASSPVNAPSPQNRLRPAAMRQQPAPDPAGAAGPRHSPGTSAATCHPSFTAPGYGPSVRLRRPRRAP